MTEVGVVHLVYGPVGIESFAQFIKSYQMYNAGMEHELIVAFKALTDETMLDRYREVVATLPHSIIQVPDEGLDISSYFYLARQLNYRYLCFLNSASAIQASGWLVNMHRHLINNNTGAVGATGSYESAYSDQINAGLINSGRSSFKELRRRMSFWRTLRARKANFAPFPNPHLRTNAFMIERMLMLGLRFKGGDKKEDALTFESGKHSLTRQIQAMNLKVLVIGKDGRGYEPPEWQESKTFRSGEQQNLLVTDNRTRQYAEADRELKRQLAVMAWGR